MNGHTIVAAVVEPNAASVLGAAAATAPSSDVTAAPAAPSSFILELRAICDASAVADEEAYQEMVREVEQECSELGDVVSVSIPRGTDEHSAPALSAVGSAYVTFGLLEDAQRCSTALDGRRYNGRPVQAVLLREDGTVLYQANGGAPGTAAHPELAARDQPWQPPARMSGFCSGGVQQGTLSSEAASAERDGTGAGAFAGAGGEEPQVGSKRPHSCAAA
jgi:hypothetical protein